MVKPLFKITVARRTVQYQSRLGNSKMYRVRMPPKDPHNGCDESRGAVTGAVAEQVDTLDRSEGTATANLRYSAVN